MPPLPSSRDLPVLSLTGSPFFKFFSPNVRRRRVGADLAFVFCAEEAALPIKCYGPELMVLPMYGIGAFDAVGDDPERVAALVEASVDRAAAALDRVHGLLLGPGLGRHPAALEVPRPHVQRSQPLFSAPSLSCFEPTTCDTVHRKIRNAE